MCGHGSKRPGLVVRQPDLPSGWWLDLVILLVFSNIDDPVYVL